MGYELKHQYNNSTIIELSFMIKKYRDLDPLTKGSKIISHKRKSMMNFKQKSEVTYSFVIGRLITQFLLKKYIHGQLKQIH